MDFRRPLHVVAPTLDTDVLTVLAGSDAELSGREIHRLAGRGSHQGIRNAADRLVAEGVVERRTAGTAHLYRLNRDHVAAAWIERLANLADQVIDRLREAISGWAEPPLLAMLFGSVATGQATPASDIDLLIVRARGCDPDSPVWTRQIADLQTRATAWSGNDARILEYAAEELEHAGSDPVLGDALRDGIELHGSRRALQRSGKTRAAR
jgi:Nucleotidyltransferase domain